MKLTKVILAVLCLTVLLALCACVDARAEEQDKKTAAPSAEPVPSDTDEPVEDAFSHKTPIDEVNGKTEASEPNEKNIYPIEDWIIDIGEGYDPGTIPEPRPVEPPVEEQSVESAAEEE